MSAGEYIPERGDLVWFDFDPQSGHEQAGRRPALVVSPADFNRRTGFAFVCPITGKAKGYPFEVPLPDGLDVTGVVLADQMKSLDYRSRRFRWIAAAGEAVVEEVIGRVIPVLDPGGVWGADT